MGRKYISCELCDKVGNHHFSGKYDSAVCDICLGLPPIKQTSILHAYGQQSLEQAIFLNFQKLFGKEYGEQMNTNKFSYETADETIDRLEHLKDEYERRRGKPFDSLRQRHRNKQAALLKKEIEFDAIRAEAKQATEAYETEKLELEKLEQVIDQLTIQKKARYRKAPVMAMTE